MTTKHKIIAGFAIMVVLLGVVAFIGVSNIEESSEGFNTYRRTARLNALCSDIAASANYTTSLIFQFLDDPNRQEAIEKARASDAAMIAMLTQTESFVQDPARKERFRTALAGAHTLDGSIGGIAASLGKAVEQYQKGVQPFANTLADNMRALGQSFSRSGNLDGLAVLSEAWGHLSSARSSLGRFAESRNMEEVEKINSSLTGLRVELENLGSTLYSNESKKLYAEALQAREQMAKGARSMEALFREADANIRNVLAQAQAIHSLIVDLSDGLHKEQDSLGPRILAGNESAQTTMLGVSLGGVLIAVLLGAVIVFGIIRVLKDMAVYASNVARGDFSRQPATREKGEIGAMVEALKTIPMTLNNIMDEYQSLEKKIESGYLNSAGDASRFEGEFAVLIRGTNTILDRYLTVLENIPCPVVMLDKDLKAVYLNAIARDMAGDGWQGVACKQLFNREDYGTGACGLTRAVSTRRPAGGETIARPRGKAMNIAYTAIPALDEHGEITAVMQVLTDLTEIRAQQQTMIEVADKASEISDRVAAASEELAAQVGQISKGAEVQRTRVEATASAMAEMYSTVLEVAHSAGQAAGQSEGARGKANDGSELVNQVVRAINEVNSVALSLQGNMQGLGRQAESIGGIMNVISDIADQTNLLALNAAIEAARAGEAGRGFAVVADEVRKLAEKTMEATHEVSASISAIQNATRTNIAEVSSAVASVAEATRLAGASGQALSEIVSLASANSSIVASIATAAEEQSATSEEINLAIEEINNVVGETTEGILQSSAAVKDLSRMAQELRRVMDGLK